MYNITRTGYNSFNLTFNFDVAINIGYYKVTKLNAITNVEDGVSLSLPDDNGVYSYDEDYIKVEELSTTTVSVSLDEDGTYYIYVKIDDVEYKHILINVENITDYLFETAQDNICCCPTKPCNEAIFSHRDYVFNVVSNMSFSFLGFEFMDINGLASGLPSTLSSRITEINEIIYRINQYLLNPNFEYSC